MAYIEIANLSKSYGGPDKTPVEVLKGLDLSVNQGEFISIFGPNGCGKSTLLNIVADLVTPDSGSIRIGGNDSKEARIGFVFQDYSKSLFPWLKNVDNIGISLHAAFGSVQQRRERIRAFVRDMGLGEMPLEKYPYQCSAGQQQLVALAREFVYAPDVLLMDEPFVSLDYDRRLLQQEHLQRTWTKTKTTVLFVSHELDEAIYLADRVILLSRLPARICASFDIQLPRPRTVDTLASEEFFRIKQPILQAFREIIGK